MSVGLCSLVGSWLLNRLVVFALIVRPLVRSVLVADESECDSDNVIQPEEVQSLQGGEKTEGDPKRDFTLELTTGPVEFVGADRLKLGKERVEDLQVEVMTHVDPNAHETGKIWPNYGRVEIVQRLGGLQRKRR